MVSSQPPWFTTHSCCTTSCIYIDFYLAMGVSDRWHHLAKPRHWRGLKRSYRRWVKSTDAKEPEMYWLLTSYWLTTPWTHYYTRRRVFLSRRKRMDDGIRSNNEEAWNNLPGLQDPPLWKRMDWSSLMCEPTAGLQDTPDGRKCLECKAPLSDFKCTETRRIPCWESIQRRHQRGCSCFFQHKPGCIL